MTKEHEFDKLSWHDAVITEIVIDRHDAGVSDTIMLKMQWPSGGNGIVSFEGCYSLVANLNFGVIAEETVRTATVHREHTLLDELARKWKNATSLDDLKCFCIETNSTASLIQICAQNFSLHSSD